ncbi:acyltransferase family protein [Flavisolibacter tropicus]|uniref:Acyltransferase n=1 Tax=Flavisolibacter tropicus TaxID=1492898 RepID=A0A172TZ70_9BACT|nr:acyltransferase [Flavisolibacter tropicus]ANE52296.1 acyltransferase [Flavisolibacter tropicus]
MATQLTASASKGKLYGLDHLRTLAIVLVLIYHYRIFFHPEWIDTVGKFGWTGVDLFFVLSGYLIAAQLFKQMAAGKGLSLKQFFIKRSFRILPAYFVVVAIYFLFPYVHERPALAPLWKYLTFTQNLGLDLRTQGTFSHAWSLCIEEQFYLLLPLILLGLVYFNALKKGFWLLVGLFIAGLLIRLYCYQVLLLPQIENGAFGVLWYKWIYYPSYSRLDGLLIGVGIAAFLQYKPVQAKRILQYGNQLLVLGILILAGAYFLCLDELSFGASVFGFPLISLGYGVMVLGALSPGSVLYNYNSRTTTTIATLSYAIYLVHKFIIHITQDQLAKLGVDKNSNLMLGICVVTVLLGAWVLNRLVEKPFLKMRDRVLQDKQVGKKRKLVVKTVEE